MTFTRKEAQAIAATCNAIGRTQGAHVCVLAEPKPEKVVGMDSAFAIAVVRVTPAGHKRSVCLSEAEAVAAAQGIVPA